jgi:hypothetical protein
VVTVVGDAEKESAEVADFAVVVGVGRYPLLAAEGVAPDLEGPDNDAQAVREWLVDPGGAGLPMGNVKVIRSVDFDPLDPLDPQPATQRVERELQWVEQQTRQTPGGRLYLYFSGHGFSPVFEEGALFTAEATQLSPSYVYAHAWLRWFRKAQRFRESVLWMDCCMNYQQSIPVREVLMRAQLGTGVPGPAFISLAAQTKSALECRMPDGRVHGVFTWTLLQGLRGGAADERGRVTGESLRAFLYNVMPEFLPEDARTSTSVDLQPFVRADEGMVFRRLPTRPKYPVHLTFPAGAVGKELRIWTGRPLTRATSQVLDGEEWSGELLRGLYVAEMPAAGLRQGFQVSGAGAVDVAVTRPGPPVVVPDGSELFSLNVVADNPAAAITVVDYRFDRIFRETGELDEREVPGVYKVREEFGRDITMVSEEVLLLDRDLRVGSTGPPLSSAAPLPGTAATQEPHVAQLRDVADRRGVFTGPSPGLAAISVIAQYWTMLGRSSPPSQNFPHPMQGLQLADEVGRPVADLSQNCQVDVWKGSAPVAIWEREIPPGAYFLRQTLLNGRIFEACVQAAPNWVTQIVIQPVFSGQEETAVTGGIDDASIFMRPAGGGARAADQDAVIEAARMALRQGRNLFGEGRGEQLRELLLRKLADPIAGIIGGHLLLRAMDQARPDPVHTDMFDAVVVNLRSLVGPGHPDVEALSLRCTNLALRAVRPFSAPPTFSRSWQLLTEASFRHPELVPVELWRRVHASIMFSSYFIWAADENTRAAHAQQLSHWISEFIDSDHRPRPPATLAPAGGGRGDQATAPPDLGKDSLPDAARDAALRLQMPAAAADALWKERSIPQPGGARPVNA